MRVTQQILFSNFMRDVSSNRAQMGEIQSDLSSGKSVRVASQNPINFQRSRILEENIRKEEQYQSNIDSGLRQARLAQESLDETIDRLIDLKGIVVQGSTSSAGESVMKNMAQEVAAMRDGLINTLNLSYGDRYLFAGTNSSEKPFVKDTTAPGGVANNSNDTAPTVLVGDAVRVEMTVAGTEITDTPVGDLFVVLEDIEQALLSNDTSAVNAQLENADALIEHVTDVTARLGNNINNMEFMYERYESFRITQRSDISSLVDTDFAQAFSDLQRTQVAYESAMAVHSTMFKNTLLDYI
tara:strand:+ start:228696 stop:229589 length:894 start_codon:yes stop_codon:yes gene_type:complete